MINFIDLGLLLISIVAFSYLLRLLLLLNPKYNNVYLYSFLTVVIIFARLIFLYFVNVELFFALFWIYFCLIFFILLLLVFLKYRSYILKLYVFERFLSRFIQYINCSIISFEVAYLLIIEHYGFIKNNRRKDFVSKLPIWPYTYIYMVAVVIVDDMLRTYYGTFSHPYSLIGSTVGIAVALLSYDLAKYLEQMDEGLQPIYNKWEAKFNEVYYEYCVVNDGSTSGGSWGSPKQIDSVAKTFSEHPGFRRGFVRTVYVVAFLGLFSTAFRAGYEAVKAPERHQADLDVKNAQAESSRAQAEASRAQAEASRAQAEASRAQAEASRAEKRYYDKKFNSLEERNVFK